MPNQNDELTKQIKNLDENLNKIQKMKYKKTHTNKKKTMNEKNQIEHKKEKPN